MTLEIKAVFFDYGNVLCMPQLPSDLEEMSFCLRADNPTFVEAYWHFRDQFDLGALTGEDYWSKIAKRCGVSVSNKQINRLIDLDNIGWSRPNELIAGWAGRLRESGIVTAVVSNMPSDIRQHLHTVEWLPVFDQYSFSCELSSLKPDAKIYQHTLECLSVQPANVLFLDDRQINVDAARELGMQSFVFTNAMNLYPFVQATGLPELFLAVPATTMANGATVV